MYFPQAPLIKSAKTVEALKSLIDYSLFLLR
jgi:hypothetical protein